MAIINCSECDGRVSDRAPICPHCGVANDTDIGANVYVNNEQLNIKIGGLPVEVKVVDIEMSFMAMVTFMVKLAFAALPAALIILVIVTLFGGVLAAMFGR